MDAMTSMFIEDAINRVNELRCKCEPKNQFCNDGDDLIDEFIAILKDFK